MPARISHGGKYSQATDELNALAQVLEGRHGVLAAPIAEFFASFHNQGDDRNRAKAWAKVADIVRTRERQRIGAASASKES
jgi:hypothetical protein